MKNIIIYGGAFDPIHNGHMQMAIKASEALSAEVFFVPAKIAIWKSESIAIEDKIAMLKLAIEEYRKEDVFKISLYEAESKEESNYSIDTVKHFQELYKDDKLYLLIGADQVNSFHKWKDSEEIANICQIIYFNRPGFEIDRTNIRRYNMKEIPGKMVDMSSTQLRELKRLNIPYSVMKYIVEHNLYFTPKLHTYLSDYRFLHSYEVAKLSYEIAVSNSLEDPDKYFIVGLLHDIGKELSPDRTEEIMDKYFAMFKDLNRVLWHQFTGAYLAAQDFKVENNEMLGAIMYHTTGNENMTPIAMVLYAADKIEPTRGFDSSSLIDSMKKDYDRGFKTVLEANLDYFHEKNIDHDNRLTESCIKQYLDLKHRYHW